VVKGGNDSNQTAFQVYQRFSQERDNRGNPFKFSLKRRGLIHGDAVFNQPERIGGEAFINYLSRWFCPTELISNTGNKALVILPEFSKHFGAQMRQGRYAALFHSLFENVE
jgi:hypothetical protein